MPARSIWYSWNAAFAVSHSSCEMAAIGGVEELAEPRQLLGRQPPDRPLRGMQLERDAHVVPLLERVRGDRRHVVPAPGLHREEPFGDETRERVVHRAARHAQLGGELVQAQLLARAGGAGEDPLPQRLVDLFVEVRARQGGRHTQM